MISWIGQTKTGTYAERYITRFGPVIQSWARCPRAVSFILTHPARYFETVVLSSFTAAISRGEVEAFSGNSIYNRTDLRKFSHIVAFYKLDLRSGLIDPTIEIVW